MIAMVVVGDRVVVCKWGDKDGSVLVWIAGERRRLAAISVNGGCR